jgi:hypothetical protein
LFLLSPVLFISSSPLSFQATLYSYAFGNYGEVLTSFTYNTAVGSIIAVGYESGTQQGFYYELIGGTKKKKNTQKYTFVYLFYHYTKERNINIIGSGPATASVLESDFAPQSAVFNNYDQYLIQ